MKPVVWCIVVLAPLVAGCAGRQGAVSARQDARVPATQHGPVADAGGAPASQDTRPTPDPDDDFGVLDQDLTERAAAVSDPIESWNRMVFGLNDGLYVWVARPVLQGYEALVPRPARVGVSNAFHNVTTPVRAVNCVLQGKFGGAGTELHRFAINTTVGILGVRDAARSDYGLEPVEEDLGQTLGTYGFASGWYLVWPIFGPSTARDSVGTVGDQFLNPVRYVPPVWLSLSISAADTVNEASLRRGEYESLKADAVDPYVAVRQAYLQYRDKKTKE